MTYDPLSAYRDIRRQPTWPGLRIRVVIGFLAIFGLLNGTYLAGKGGPVERLFIDRLTVRPAAVVIATLTPGIAVRAEGRRLHATGGGISVYSGCEGTDVFFLLVSAFLVAPLGWRSRLKGIATGAIFVWALNQARIVALFYAYRSDRAMFDSLHGTLGPLVAIMLTSIFFALWVEHGYRRGVDERKSTAA